MIAIAAHQQLSIQLQMDAEYVAFISNAATAWFSLELYVSSAIIYWSYTGIVMYGNV